MIKIVKKSFTLLEVLISISLLFIIILFLYQALDVSEKSNQFFYNHVVKKLNKSEIKEILFKDTIHSIEIKNKITLHKDKNNILSLQSSNTYHNAFYENITYLVSKENNLLRIESLYVFNKDQLNDKFFEKAYVDTIANNVEKFKVIKTNKNQYAIYLKFKDESDMMFVLKSMR